MSNQAPQTKPDSAASVSTAGLGAPAIYLAFSDNGEHIRFWTASEGHAREWARENWETEPFFSAAQMAALAPRAEWDDAGEAASLAAAAEDADEWLALIERLHESGRWKFSEADSAEKLRGCRRALRRLLASNA